MVWRGPFQSNDIALLGRLNDCCDSAGARNVGEEHAPRKGEVNGAPLIGDVDVLADDLKVEHGIDQNRAAHRYPSRMRRKFGGTIEANPFGFGCATVADLNRGLSVGNLISIALDEARS